MSPWELHRNWMLHYYSCASCASDTCLVLYYVRVKDFHIIIIIIIIFYPRYLLIPRESKN